MSPDTVPEARALASEIRFSLFSRVLRLALARGARPAGELRTVDLDPDWTVRIGRERVFVDHRRLTVGLLDGGEPWFMRDGPEPSAFVAALERAEIETALEGVRR